MIRQVRAVLAMTCLAAAGTASALPSFVEFRSAHQPSDVTLLDRNGVPIQTLRVDNTVRRLAWVSLRDMSPALLHAIVLSEDRRFWEHSGVDWTSVAGSAWANAFNTRTRGASTLTMQLAGLIDENLAQRTGGRSVAQKIGQVLAAGQLEARWKKSEILEAYINAVPFRGEIIGIDALAQTLFGKHPSGLDRHEAAIAAALVRAPNAKPARVAERACELLRLQAFECTGVTVLVESALARQGSMPLGEQLAPHFARQVLRLDGASQQRSTLDARVQRVALVTLRDQLAELSGRNVEDGAIVVLENASGNVLAWVGSSGALSDAPQVDGVLARRQPGSTLKPFVYALAFEQRLATPATLLDDSPAQISTAAGLYLPQNYDREFRGWVSVRTSLGSSLNVPAVRMAAMLGPDALLGRLNAFGLNLTESAGFYGHALALGGADVTLLALTNAYRALANGGLMSPPVLRGDTERSPSRRVADAAAVHLVTDILADNSARASTFGLSSALATTGFAAVKTGTSKDLRDNWCVGFTDRFTVGVWIGNASGEPMRNVSGVSGAAPVWRSLVRYLHAQHLSRPPAQPRGVVAMSVAFEDAREPTRTEVFMVGTEQLQQRASAQVSVARFGITSPRDGSVFALDPDIPLAAQRITFEGERGVWILDGRRFGQGDSLAWQPWPGQHELTLLGSNGRPLQTVRFEVRGAAVRHGQRSSAVLAHQRGAVQP